METIHLSEENDKHIPRTFGIGSCMQGIFSSRQPVFSLSERFWNPPIDVYETADSVVVKMEIAGINEKHLEIVVEKNFLHIKGRRVEEAPIRKECFHVVEIRYGSFERSFELPGNINKEDIAAAYKDGFLKVTIPKGKMFETKKVHIDIKEEK